MTKELNDCEAIFHIYYSNSVMHCDDDEIIIGVQSKEHNMHFNNPLKIGKECSRKIIRAFIDLRDVMYAEIQKDEE